MKKLKKKLKDNKKPITALIVGAVTGLAAAGYLDPEVVNQIVCN